MADGFPLVSVMISTRNRPEDLRETLQALRRLDYPSVEVIVIDDCSDTSLKPLVSECWPDAVFVRHDINMGMCISRNEGFQLSTGEFILQLDDDCCLVGVDDLKRAVRVLQREPLAAALMPYHHNGKFFSSEFLRNSRLQEGFIANYVGAAVLFRTAALRSTIGYRDYFESEFEDPELSMQLISLGWGIYFHPAIVAHHRVSAINRNRPRTWKNGLRNRCWAMIIHMPWYRLPVELSWKLFVGAWDAIRLNRVRPYARALAEMIGGLPKVLIQRRPFSDLHRRRYDALRTKPVLSFAQFHDPAPFSIREMLGWWERWRNRARDRNVWDASPGSIGCSYSVNHEQKDSL